MINTGVDILHIDRVRAALERHGARFLSRVYTPGEISYCSGRLQALAARFAAKEAASKALGTGMLILSAEGIGFHEAEVVNDPRGRPILVLHGRAALLARTQGWREWSLSLAHERDIAIAVVTARD